MNHYCVDGITHYSSGTVLVGAPALPDSSAIVLVAGAVDTMEPPEAPCAIPAALFTIVSWLISTVAERGIHQGPRWPRYLPRRNFQCSPDYCPGRLFLVWNFQK